MGFTREFIEKVREANNIVDLAGQYTVLRQSSSNFMGRCPFPDHNDKTASFSVSETKQLYHCFGCKKSGTAYNFVQSYLGLGFPEAVEYLASRAGVPIERDSESTSFADRFQPFYETHRVAFEAYHNKLKNLDKSNPVWEYIKKRGLSEEIIEEFGLGYAPDSWDFVTNRLMQQHYPEKVLKECGLVIPRKSGKGFYDRFRGRLIFPIFNTMDRCIGLGGRILEEGEPKYLNSPETPVFHKSRVLYGLNRNSRFIRSQDEAIIVEGYMDLIALAQFEVRNVAATLGTALTADHAKLIKRMTNNVLVLFDGDSAGIAAAEKSLPVLLRAGLIPRSLILKDGKDPDDFIRSNGKEEFDKLIQNAPQLFDVVVGSWLEGYSGSASQKMKLVEKLAPIVAEMAEPALRQLYLRELAAKVNVDEKWLRSALWQQIKNKGARTVPPQVAEQASQMPPPPPPPEEPMGTQGTEIRLKNAARAELTLLGLALKTKVNFDLIASSGVSEYLVNEGIKSLYSRIVEINRQEPEGFDRLLASVLPFVDQPEKLSMAFEVESGDSLAEHRLVEDCIEKIKEMHLKRRGSHLSVEIKVNPDSKRVEEFLNIHKQRLGMRNIKENYETEEE